MAPVHPPAVAVRALPPAAHLAAQGQPAGRPRRARVHEGLGEVGGVSPRSANPGSAECDSANPGRAECDSALTCTHTDNLLSVQFHF